MVAMDQSCLSQERRIIRWKNFEKEIMNRFGPLEYADHDEALAHIKQTGTLREYQKEFEKLANRVRDWQESALVGAFIGGLKAEIAAEVRVHQPRTYAEKIDYARLHEDHLNSKRVSRVEPRKTRGSMSEGRTGGLSGDGKTYTSTPRPLSIGIRQFTLG